MDYGILIKKIRDTLMLSQNELAEKLGVSFATINRWEKGHHQPTIKLRREINAFCKKHGIEE
jgi:putative transcriptional regulator